MPSGIAPVCRFWIRSVLYRAITDHYRKRWAPASIYIVMIVSVLSQVTAWHSVVWERLRDEPKERRRVWPVLDCVGGSSVSRAIERAASGVRSQKRGRLSPFPPRFFP